MDRANTDLKPFLKIVAEGQSLSRDQAMSAFDVIMSGAASPSQIGAFLMALRMRGETVDEITGAAHIMRSKALSIPSAPGAIDTVGTGGDGASTWNISTAAAFIVAACDIPVAKHGNRALTSKSGAADVLKALNINIDAPMDIVASALQDVGITFLMAPRHHSAMRHVMPTRQELGIRTVFNLLGPLTNPAHVKRQLVGVFAKDWIVPMAKVLHQLGSEKAWVVHGSDGLDELTTTGPSFVAVLEKDQVSEIEIHPETYGLPRADPQALKGGTATENAAALRKLFEGETGAYRDIVLLNAGATLVIADKANDLQQAIEMAKEALESGKAMAKLELLSQKTNTSPSS